MQNSKATCQARARLTAHLTTNSSTASTEKPTETRQNNSTARQTSTLRHMASASTGSTGARQARQARPRQRLDSTSTAPRQRLDGASTARQGSQGAGITLFAVDCWSTAVHHCAWPTASSGWWPPPLLPVPINSFAFAAAFAAAAAARPPLSCIQ